MEIIYGNNQLTTEQIEDGIAGVERAAFLGMQYGYVLATDSEKKIQYFQDLRKKGTVNKIQDEIHNQSDSLHIGNP